MSKKTKKTASKTKPKKTKRLVREDVNQAAFRVMREVTEKHK